MKGLDVVSIIIPSRNEKYLETTIKNVLENARGEIEIIAILDGWDSPADIKIDDSRVIFINHEKNEGQRQSINEAARMAKGKYIMKLDAHCAVDEGFDIKLAENCEYSWTVVPRMYNLDITTWKPKLHKRTDYMYISSMASDKPFRATYYGSSQLKNDLMIDDTMCCMGPCFFMHKDRFFELGGCDEGHGGWGQQGIEVACKAWLSGGALKVNKKTWFAHWFRGGTYDEVFSPGFPYKASGREQEQARKYSQDIWLNNKWDKRVRDFQWMVDKFNPPGWDVKKKDEVDYAKIYRTIRTTYKIRAAYDFAPYGAKYNGGDRLTLLDIFAKLGYTKGVEIGVSRGSYSEEMLKRIPNLTLHCVDPWIEYQFSHLSNSVQEKNYNLAVKRLSKWIENGQCKIIRKHSEDAVADFNNGSLDFVYIDGAHDFDSVCIDIIKWYPKIRFGGMIGVHDYYLASKRNGVVPAVDAFTKCHKIKDWFVTYEVMPTAFWVKEPSSLEINNG